MTPAAAAAKRGNPVDKKCATQSHALFIKRPTLRAGTSDSLDCRVGTATLLPTPTLPPRNDVVLEMRLVFLNVLDMADDYPPQAMNWAQQTPMVT